MATQTTQIWGTEQPVTVPTGDPKVVVVQLLRVEQASTTLTTERPVTLTTDQKVIEAEQLKTLFVKPTGAATTESTTPLPESSKNPATASISSDTTALPTFTSRSNNSTGKASKNDGLEGGAVAGVAIGMLLAGVLIAGVVFFFLLRRQKRRQHDSFNTNHLPPAEHASRPEKSAVVSVAPVVTGKIDNYLPQPVSDDTLTDDISKIRDNLKNHVRTFYHSAPATSAINEAALGNMAAATGTSTAKLVKALTNPATRPEVLRLVMAWVIMTKTTGPQNATLLPPNLCALSSEFADSGRTTAGLVLYSKWKTITGALIQQGQSDKNSQNSYRAQASASVIQELDALVAPFVRSDIDQAQRSKNLDMIVTRAANFAMLLFSQPGAFHFNFGASRGGLPVFPAFVQSVDDESQPINPHRVLLEAEIVAI